LAGVNVNRAVPGERVVASVRPERVVAHLASPRDEGNTLQATVSSVIYFGDHLRLRCALAGQPQATVKLPLANGEQPIVGQTVWLQFPSAYLRIYA
jgi:putative spermidine/putrescine transport system ATP-binding protein